MDPLEFEQRLKEATRVKEQRLARDEPGARRGDPELAPKWLQALPEPRPAPCGFDNCDRENKNQFNHTRDRATQRWRTTCATCHRPVDLENNRVLPGRGVYYQNQGLRVASPGKRLGRPPKTPKKEHWWNEAAVFPTQEEIQAREDRRMELLDRLDRLRTNK